MRKVGSVSAFVVGLLLVALGVAGLVLVDTDDVLRSPATRVDLADAAGVRSSPGVLALSDATVIVEARAGTAVLLAAAHPVDVRAWLAGRSTRPVTAVDTSGPTIGAPSVMPARAGATSASPPTQPLPPLAEIAALDVWTLAEHGAGWQRLDLVRDGSPVTYVALPEQPGTSVEVRQGLLLPWVRPLAMALVAVSVLLLGLGGWLWRRRPATASRATSLAQASDATGADGLGARPRARARTVTPLLATGLLLGVSGCAAVPERAPLWDERTVTKTAMMSPQVPSVLASYDERNNGAIAQSRATGDPAVWSQADAWALLEADTWSTRVGRELPEQQATLKGTHTGDRAYAPGFGGYPMWAMVPTHVRFGDGDPRNLLGLFTKESVDSPWRQSANAWLIDTDLPAPLVGRDAAVSEEQMAAAVAAAKDVRQTLNDAAQPGAIALVGALSSIAQDRAKAVGDAAVVSTQATFFRGSDEDQLVGASVHAVRVDGDSLLVMVTYTHTSTLTAQEGRSFEFSNEAVAKALAKQGQLQSAMLRAVCSAAIVIDPAGAATMAGSGCHEIV